MSTSTTPARDQAVAPIPERTIKFSAGAQLAVTAAADVPLYREDTGAAITIGAKDRVRVLSYHINKTAGTSGLAVLFLDGDGDGEHSNGERIAGGGHEVPVQGTTDVLGKAGAKLKCKGGGIGDSAFVCASGVVHLG